MRLSKTVAVVFLACLALQPQMALANVTEPSKITSPAKLKADEGAVRLSVRTQRQFTETFFLYLVRLDENGGDTDSYFRIERGAGVPIAGSNMIDPKPVIYRFPAGRYRLLGYTMRCEGVPFEGAMCMSSLSGMLPTGYYGKPAPTFDVRAGGLTEAGDFILEYTGPLPTAEIDGIEKVDPLQTAIRWRALADGRPAAFANLAVADAPAVPAGFESRIMCEARPKGVMLFIPFAC